MAGLWLAMGACGVSADDRVVVLALERASASDGVVLPRFWDLFRELSDGSLVGDVFVDPARVALALVQAASRPQNHMFVSSFASLLPDGVVRRVVAASALVRDVSRWGLSPAEWQEALVVCAAPENRAVVEMCERVWGRVRVGSRNPFREVVEAAGVVGVLSGLVSREVVCCLADGWPVSVEELVEVVVSVAGLGV